VGWSGSCWAFYGVSMSVDLDQLVKTVQHNCDISDARHAARFTLCTYLMKMRELYRWEQGLGLEEDPGKEALGSWVRDRESYWEAIVDREFVPIELDGANFDPFEQDAINQRLEGEGLVYSAGLGQASVPHFFLADVRSRRLHDGYSVWVAGREYARDLASPPAMSRDGVVFLRYESLRRLMWERVQEWRWNRPDNAMGRALKAFGLDGAGEGALEQGLDAVTEVQLDLALWHELGEIGAGRCLPEDWRDMLQRVSDTPVEHRVRALRDNLADALSTWPRILESGDTRMVHLYFALLTPLRRALQSSLVAAYEQYLETGSMGDFAPVVEKGRSYWKDRLVTLLERFGSADKVDIKQLSSEIDGWIL